MLRSPLSTIKLWTDLLSPGKVLTLNVIIIFNKIDLDENHSMRKWVNLYKTIGYKTLTTSVITDESLDKLKKLCIGKINLFWGQSGVGKSSLLNKIFPHLNLETGLVSSSTDKGLHTTVTSVLIKVGKDTFVIDTPGIREIDPFGIRKEDLCHYFLEFGQLLPPIVNLIHVRIIMNRGVKWLKLSKIAKFRLNVTKVICAYLIQ